MCPLCPQRKGRTKTDKEMPKRQSTRHGVSTEHRNQTSAPLVPERVARPTVHVSVVDHPEGGPTLENTSASTSSRVSTLSRLKHAPRYAEHNKSNEAIVISLSSTVSVTSIGCVLSCHSSTRLFYTILKTPNRGPQHTEDSPDRRALSVSPPNSIRKTYTQGRKEEKIAQGLWEGEPLKPEFPPSFSRIFIWHPSSPCTSLSTLLGHSPLSFLCVKKKATKKATSW